MKRVRQGMTSSQVMTVNNMTNPAFFVFCFSKCQGTIKCSVFHKFCYFVRYFNHLWVPEQKSVEGLRRRTDYWHCDHEWERKCWFCLIANNTSAHSWTRGAEASVSSLIRSPLEFMSEWRIRTISCKFCQMYKPALRFYIKYKMYKKILFWTEAQLLNKVIATFGS